MGIIVTPPNGREIARDYARRVLALVGGRPNYSWFSVEGRYEGGFLCELGFKELLTQAGRRFIHRVKADGTSQPCEFVTFRGGARFGIEVKGRLSATAAEFMKSKKQWDKDSAVTVGARVVGDSVEIMGWLGTMEIEHVCLTKVHREEGKPDRESWVTPWGRMSPINRLILMLDEGGEEHEPGDDSARVGSAGRGDGLQRDRGGTDGMAERMHKGSGTGEAEEGREQRPGDRVVRRGATGGGERRGGEVAETETRTRRAPTDRRRGAEGNPKTENAGWDDEFPA